LGYWERVGASGLLLLGYMSVAAKRTSTKVYNPSEVIEGAGGLTVNTVKKSAVLRMATEGVATHRIQELETTVSNLRQLLDTSRAREKKLASKLEDMGCSISLDVESGSFSTQLTPGEMTYGRCPLEPNVSISAAVLERGGWLVGLLFFQSFSSFILSSHESLLSGHPSIIFYLTMLVGAGGNAGNQAAVRVIRGIALGTVNPETTRFFLFRELMMAVSLSALLGVVGFIRTLVSGQTSFAEAVVICIALMVIVFISILTGAVLPLGLHYFGIDPAHSSTTIQVIMDISGVLISCTVATALLDTQVGKMLLMFFGVM
jgi:cation transporter-like permease